MVSNGEQPAAEQIPYRMPWGGYNQLTTGIHRIAKWLVPELLKVAPPYSRLITQIHRVDYTDHSVAGDVAITFGAQCPDTGVTGIVGYEAQTYDIVPYGQTGLEVWTERSVEINTTRKRPRVERYGYGVTIADSGGGGVELMQSPSKQKECSDDPLSTIVKPPEKGTRDDYETIIKNMRALLASLRGAI